MAKLDRLGWTAGISFDAYGQRFGVRTNDRALLERLLDRLPPGWKRADSPRVTHLFSFLSGGAGARPGVRRYHLVYAGSARLARTLELDAAMRSLESALDLTLAATARRRVFVRAGVVGWRGRGVLLVGPAGSGQSRLLRALLEAGGAYLSNRYAVLDAAGRVHAYPVPLGAGPAGAPPAAARPLSVGLVLLSRYQPGARWRPRALSPGQGALALLGGTVPARLRPEASLAALRRAVAAARIVKGVRGEAEDVVAWLREDA